MCAPVLALAAAGVGAAGTLVSGFSQAAQYRAAAKTDRVNATFAADNARDAVDNTRLEAQRRYRQAAQLEGAQQASMAANGIDLGFGSAAQVDADSRMIAGEDVQQIYKDGLAKVQSYDREGWSYRASANANQSKASGAIVSAVFGAASTVLGGAKQYAGLKAKPASAGGQ